MHFTPFQLFFSGGFFEDFPAALKLSVVRNFCPPSLMIRQLDERRSLMIDLFCGMIPSGDPLIWTHAALGPLIWTPLALGPLGLQVVGNNGLRTVVITPGGAVGGVYFGLTSHR